MNARYDEVMKALWAQCCQFNDAVPVGARVLFVIDGKTYESVTTAPACALSTCKVGVMVAGQRDYVSIENVLEVRA